MKSDRLVDWQVSSPSILHLYPLDIYLLHINLPTNLLTYLPIYLRTYLFTYLLTYVPTYLTIYLPT